MRWPKKRKTVDVDQREKGILHEMGNCLHLISGFSEVLIARGTYKREESMHDVGAIHENARRAIVLFRELRKLRGYG